MGSLSNSIGMVGDESVRKALLNLGNNIARSVMRPAVAAGLKPIQTQARANAAPGAALSPEASGLMWKAIKSATKARKDKVTGKVYVDRKTEGVVDGKRHVPGFIAHLVEFGHGGKHPAPAHPFLRPALDSRQGEAFAAVTDKARELLPAAVEKAKR